MNSLRQKRVGLERGNAPARRGPDGVPVPGGFNATGRMA
jgi:hypothetical protein